MTSRFSAALFAITLMVCTGCGASVAPPRSAPANLPDLPNFAGKMSLLPHPGRALQVFRRQVETGELTERDAKIAADLALALVRRQLREPLANPLPAFRFVQKLAPGVAARSQLEIEVTLAAMRRELARAGGLGEAKARELAGSAARRVPSDPRLCWRSPQRYDVRTLEECLQFLLAGNARRIGFMVAEEILRRGEAGSQSLVARKLRAEWLGVPADDGLPQSPKPAEESAKAQQMKSLVNRAVQAPSVQFESWLGRQLDSWNLDISEELALLRLAVAAGAARTVRNVAERMADDEWGGDVYAESAAIANIALLDTPRALLWAERAAATSGSPSQAFETIGDFAFLRQNWQAALTLSKWQKEQSPRGLHAGPVMRALECLVELQRLQDAEWLAEQWLAAADESTADESTRQQEQLRLCSRTKLSILSACQNAASRLDGR